MVWISVHISIHAPRMGSDLVTQAGVTSNNISIHAPRMGSDLTERVNSSGSHNFNPRSPHGERQHSF